jgi:hypothetical protein
MVNKQLRFGDYEQATAKKCTRRERFLTEMEEVVPWNALLNLIVNRHAKLSRRRDYKSGAQPCGELCRSLSRPERWQRQAVFRGGGVVDNWRRFWAEPGADITYGNPKRRPACIGPL